MANQVHNVNNVLIDEINVEEGLRGCKDTIGLENGIKKDGLILPIVIRPVKDLIDNFKYSVICGRHRLQACKKLGWKEIPARIIECSDREAKEMEIAENYNRKELTILERAEHTNLLKDYYVEDGNKARNFSKNYSEKLGVSIKTIQNDLKITRDISQKFRQIIKNQDLNIQNSTTQLLLLTSRKSEEIEQILELMSKEEYKNINVTDAIKELKLDPEEEVTETEESENVLADSDKNDDIEDKVADPEEANESEDESTNMDKKLEPKKEVTETEESEKVPADIDENDKAEDEDTDGKEALESKGESTNTDEMNEPEEEGAKTEESAKVPADIDENDKAEDEDTDGKDALESKIDLEIDNDEFVSQDEYLDKKGYLREVLESNISHDVIIIDMKRFSVTYEGGIYPIPRAYQSDIKAKTLNSLIIAATNKPDPMSKCLKC